MTQSVLDTPTAQQPDTTVAATAQAIDTAPAVLHIQPRSITVHYNTVIPETLVRPHDSIFNPTIDTTEYLLMCNDSLFAAYSEKPVIVRKSMFKTNTNAKAEVQPRPHDTPAGTDWIFASIIILLTLVSIYINNQKFKPKDIIQSLFDLRVLERVARESNIRIPTLLPMVGIYLASLAMVILKTALTYSNLTIQIPTYLFFLLTLTALIAFLLVKNGLIRLIGNIFEDKNVAIIYIISNSLFYLVGGLLVTPLLLLIYYFTPAEDAILKITISIIAILFIVRILRGMQLILTNSKTSKLYLFYYLCIFEIIPIIITSKLILF